MKDVYLLSGLGADKRVFDFIDLSGFRINYIHWIEPGKGETIENYARRLATQVHAANPVLIGVSFGGMVAVELAKWIKTDHVILISSAKTKEAIPIYFRMAGRLKLNRIIPARLLKIVNRFTFLFFGAETKEDESLLRAIIQDTDEKFLKWAIDQIVNWKNVALLSNTIHIHGTHDHILPLRSADHKIHDGGHFMIVNKADQVSKIIRGILK